MTYDPDTGYGDGMEIITDSNEVAIISRPQPAVQSVPTVAAEGVMKKVQARAGEITKKVHALESNRMGEVERHRHMVGRKEGLPATYRHKLKCEKLKVRSNTQMRLSFSINHIQKKTPSFAPSKLDAQLLKLDVSRGGPPQVMRQGILSLGGGRPHELDARQLRENAERSAKAEHQRGGHSSQHGYTWANASHVHWPPSPQLSSRSASEVLKTKEESIKSRNFMSVPTLDTRNELSANDAQPVKPNAAERAEIIAHTTRLAAWRAGGRIGQKPALRGTMRHVKQLAEAAREDNHVSCLCTTHAGALIAFLVALQYIR